MLSFCSPASERGVNSEQEYHVGKCMYITNSSCSHNSSFKLVLSGLLNSSGYLLCYCILRNKTVHINHCPQACHQMKTPDTKSFYDRLGFHENPQSLKCAVHKAQGTLNIKNPHHEFQRLMSNRNPILSTYTTRI